MSRKERHALAILAGLVLLGHGLRVLIPANREAPGALTLLSALPGSTLSAHIAQSERLARPLAAGERIDLNAAEPADIARLPRIGMALAKRIVAARAEWGGFVSMAEVDQVPGIGPSLLAALDSAATLGDTLRVRSSRKPGQGPAPTAGRGRATSRAPASSRAPGSASPGGPTIYARDLPVGSAPRPDAAGGARPGARRPINLNTATERELVTLPGIGPTRARAIVAYRQSHGLFASVEDLEKVPGISRRLVGQLAPQVTVR